MKKAKRTWWMLVLILGVVGSILLVGFSASQSSVKGPVSLEDIYDLLVTDSGQNRLGIIVELLNDIDGEVDLIYLQAEEMMEEEGWQFEKQRWTLDDIKLLLDELEIEIQCIATGHGCP